MKFEGTYVAMVTPFDNDKQIDEDFKNNAYINQIKDLGENIPN